MKEPRLRLEQSDVDDLVYDRDVASGFGKMLDALGVALDDSATAVAMIQALMLQGIRDELHQLRTALVPLLAGDHVLPVALEPKQLYLLRDALQADRTTSLNGDSRLEVSVDPQDLQVLRDALRSDGDEEILQGTSDGEMKQAVPPAVNVLFEEEGMESFSHSIPAWRHLK